MNEVGGVSNQAILDELNKRDTAGKEGDDKTDFLKLLVAQLNNQNPLSPQENGEFLAQLAQFSTVEGVERLNSTLDQFTSSMLSNQALQATALVGRSVQIPHDTGQLTSGYPLTGSVDLETTTANLRLDVFDSAGALVRQIPMGTYGAGKVKFSWDGFDSNGVALPSGQYTIVANGSQNNKNEQPEVRVDANVNSVTMSQSGDVLLNLEGALGSIALNDIVQIN